MCHKCLYYLLLRIMPNTSSAKKELRKSHKRRLLNRAQRSNLRTVIKKFQTVVAGDDPAAAETALRQAAKQLDKAAAKNLIHKNKAARTKSRLTKSLAKSTSASE